MLCCAFQGLAWRHTLGLHNSTAYLVAGAAFLVVRCPPQRLLHFLDASTNCVTPRTDLAQLGRLDSLHRLSSGRTRLRLRSFSKPGRRRRARGDVALRHDHWVCKAVTQNHCGIDCCSRRVAYGPMQISGFLGRPAVLRSPLSTPWLPAGARLRR